jgi:hypothetical protein
MAECADLELSLNRLGDSTYSVDFRFSMPGSDTETRLGAGEQVLAQLDLNELQALKDVPQEYADSLTQALFASPLLQTKLAEAFSNAQSRNIPIRFRFLIGPSAPELHNIRWEVLRNPLDKSPLATDQNIIFSRYLTSSSWNSIGRKPKGNLRALVVVANPSDLKENNFAPIDADKELEIVKKGLSGIDVVSISGETANDTLKVIVSKLEAEVFDILYLVSHGYTANGESFLCFQDEQGKLQRVAGLNLATQIKELPNQPRLVILVSCQSAGKGTGEALKSFGPRLAEIGIPAVIAMQSNLLMETAAEFLPEFFTALNRDGQIDRAMSSARGKIRDRDDYWVPVLFMRLKSGRLWYTPGFGEAGKGAQNLPAIILNINEWKCTPIIGPGLVEPIIGSKRETARAWSEKYNYPLEVYERESLPQVAQYLTVNQAASFPFDTLKSQLRQKLQTRYKDLLSPPQLTPRAELEELINVVGAERRKSNPSDPYKILSGLNLPIYITASQDTLLEKVLEEDGKKPRTLLCPWNEDIEKEEYQDEPTDREPLVFHLYGRWQKPESVVLTEDHYFDFMIGFTRNKPLIPEQLRQALSASSLLFLGFQPDSWDFRILFRTILAQPGNRKLAELAQVAAQLEPDDETILDPLRARNYLEQYFFGKNGKVSIEIFWGSAEEFLLQLHSAMAGK